MNTPSRFGSGTDTLSTDDPSAAAPQDGPGAPAPDAPTAPAEPNPAEERFQSCRWRKAETPPYCTHPEVLPFAGTNGFKPDAWCPGCAFYKLRRNPRRDY